MALGILGGRVGQSKKPAFGALDASKTVQENAVNAAPVQLDGNVTLTNADGTGFKGGKLSVSLAGATSADTLGIQEAGGITVQGTAVYYNGGRIGTISSSGQAGAPLTVQFDAGPVSDEAATALARAVTYSTSSDAPSARMRVVTFQASDAENTVGTAKLKLKVSAQNDTPVVSNLAAHVSRELADAAVPRVVDGDVSIANPDGTGFKGGSLTVHLDGATSGDDITLSSGAYRISGNKLYSGNTVIGTVTSDGQDGRDLTIQFKPNANITDANMTALMRQVSHSTSDPAPPNAERTLSFTVKDKEGDVTTKQVGLSVVHPNHAPVAVADSRSTSEDTPLVFAAAQLVANDTDVDGDALTVTAVGGASHGTVALANGQVTFTPDADYHGPASFTYTVSDGKGGTATGTVNVTVTPVNDAPVAVADSRSTNEDTPLVFAAAQLVANDTDVDGDALTVTAVGGASHGTVALANGQVTFSPDADYNGPASFTYTFSDGKGGTATGTVNVTVSPVNDVPVAVADSRTTSEDTPLVFAAAQLVANDTDVDGDALTITAVGGASHGTVVLANGQVTFTPDANYNGPASFTYTVSDGKGGTATGTVNVTVAPVNDAPVAVTDSRSTSEDTPLVFAAVQLVANDTDVDGDALTVTAVGGASHGTVALANGQVTFTPDADYNGPASFTYTVSDGKGGTATGTVNVTVSPVNDAPVAVADSRSTNEDTPLVFAAAQLVANDTDVDGDALTVTAVGGASHGTVTLANGQVTFTPDADYHGPASFTYTVSDGKGGTATGTVNVTVTPVNDAPVAVTDSRSTNEDTPLVFAAAQLVANDTDVDGDALTVTAVGGASHGTVALANGQVTFTPDADYNGPASFTYTVSDGKGGTATGTVDVTVTPVNDAPVITSGGAASVAENGTGVVYTVAASDADGDALTYALTGADAELFTIDAAGNVSFKVAPDFENPADADGNNVYELLVEASDGQATSQKAVAITVTDVAENSAPVIVDAAVPVDLDANVGSVGNSYSEAAQFSPDGTKVVFYSYASNLAEGDTNGAYDVFVKDLASGGVTLVSSSATGEPGNGQSYGYQFSPDGTKVLFQSDASNLVEGDTNGTYDYFVKDLASGEVTLVSSSSTGEPGNGDSYGYQFSPDGTKVLFTSAASNLVAGDTNGTYDVFVKDLASGEVTLVNSSSTGEPGNGSSGGYQFSPDGTKVLFHSNASNLVAGDTNGTYDVFVKDLASGEVTLVSSSVAGEPGNGVSSGYQFSPDGTKVLFQSDASNLVEGDTNGRSDIFVKDLAAGVVTRVSTSATGQQGNGYSSSPQFSPDGTKVLFQSDASSLVEGYIYGTDGIFVKDLATGEITLVGWTSGGPPGSSRYQFSPDGTKVLFHSGASTLVEGDTNNNTDVFVKDLATGEVTRVSSSATGVPGNSTSYSYQFSPDGTKVLFGSYADNLVEGDTNGAYDYFVKDLVTGNVTMVNSSATGLQGNHPSVHNVQFSPDGTKMLFQSSASNLVAGDTNGDYDVFVKDLATGEVTVVSATPDYKTELTRSGAFTFDDADAADNHTVSVVPAAGTVGTLSAVIVPVADGPDRVEWVYQADRDAFVHLPAGASQQETFTLTIDDGHGGTVTQDVVVNVIGTNDVPVAADDFRSVAEDTALVIPAADLLANDTDVDGDALTVTAVGGAVNGDVTLDDEGNIVFVPDADHYGAASFVYTVSDGTGATDTATVHIDVTPVNDAPVAVDDWRYFAGPHSVTSLLANDVDADGDALFVTDVGDAQGGTVSWEDDVIMFTWGGHGAEGSFTYTVSDGHGGFAIGHVTLLYLNAA